MHKYLFCHTSSPLTSLVSPLSWRPCLAQYSKAEWPVVPRTLFCILTSCLHLLVLSTCNSSLPQKLWVNFYLPMTQSSLRSEFPPWSFPSLWPLFLSCHSLSSFLSPTQSGFIPCLSLPIDSSVFEGRCLTFLYPIWYLTYFASDIDFVCFWPSLVYSKVYFFPILTSVKLGYIF